MAEILLSLTIIGVVAAITLPALTGNINERVWNTQHKALYARLSQAIPLIPALNGYGKYEYIQNKVIDTQAETFITSALSKVIKINNICDYKHLQDCGVPEKFTNMIGSKKEWPLSFYNLAYSGVEREPYAAAFETPNGESIAVYYNRTCSSEKVPYHTVGYTIRMNICAIFMYDLNGKKGPNTMGKDIGVITAFYPIDSVVVAPRPYLPTENNKRLFKEASAFCRQEDEQSRMSNLEETMAVGYYQWGLLGFGNTRYWANGQDKSKNPNGAFGNLLESSTGYWTVSGRYFKLESTVYKDTRKNTVLCVKR